MPSPTPRFCSVTTRPHIVFALLDDAGWNDFLGSEDMPLASPRMDVLAAEGVTLHNYYTQPSCTPTRASLLTGRYPISIGMQHECLQPGSTWGLPLAYSTMPEMLKAGGYHTAMVGKWDVGHFAEDLWPTKRGFDSWLGLTCRGLENYVTYDNGGYHDIHRGTEPDRSANGTYSTELFRREALAVLRNHTREHPAEPLFLYLAFNAIHDTLSVPPDFMSTTTYELITENITFDMRRYAAGAMHIMDAAIGDVVDELKVTGMYNSTVLVVVSDNGGSPIDGGSSWPLRGTKSEYFQGGVRVPGFVHSALLPAGRRGMTFDSLVHVSDWAPTLVHGAAQVAVPDGIDGVDQWDALLRGVADGDVAAVARSEVLHNIDYIDPDTETYFDPVSHSVAALTAFVNGSLYKLILNARGKNDAMWFVPYSNTGVFLAGTDAAAGALANETSFVFNLGNDPFETTNLWADASYDAVRRALVARVCDHWTTRMTDSMYGGKVSGSAKSAMVDVYEANGNFITWWNETRPDMVSSLPISGLGQAGCPFLA